MNIQKMDRSFLTYILSLTFHNVKEASSLLNMTEPEFIDKCKNLGVSLESVGVSDYSSALATFVTAPSEMKHSSNEIFQEILNSYPVMIKKFKEYDQGLINTQDSFILKFYSLKYGQLINNYCKHELRVFTKDKPWDKVLNIYCKKVEKPLNIFNKNYGKMEFSDLQNAYKFTIPDVDPFWVKNQSLLYMVKEIFEEEYSDKMYMYFLGINSSSDNNSVKTAFLFNKFLIKAKIKDKA